MTTTSIVDVVKRLHQDHFHGDYLNFYEDLTKFLSEVGIDKETETFSLITLPYLLKLARIHGLPPSCRQPIVKQLLCGSSEEENEVDLKIQLARMLKYGATGPLLKPWSTHNPPEHLRFATRTQANQMVTELLDFVESFSAGNPEASISNNLYKMELIKEIFFAIIPLVRSFPGEHYSVDGNKTDELVESIQESKSLQRLDPETRGLLVRSFVHFSRLQKQLPDDSGGRLERNNALTASGRGVGSAVPTPYTVITETAELESTTYMGFLSEKHEMLQSDVSDLYEQSELMKRSHHLKSLEKPIEWTAMKKPTRVTPESTIDWMDRIHLELTTNEEVELSVKEKEELIKAFTSKNLRSKLKVSAADLNVKIFQIFHLQTLRRHLDSETLKKLLERTVVIAKKSERSKYSDEHKQEIFNCIFKIVEKAEQLDPPCADLLVSLVQLIGHSQPDLSRDLREILIFRYRHGISENIQNLLTRISVNGEKSEESTKLDLEQLLRTIKSGILNNLKTFGTEEGGNLYSAPQTADIPTHLLETVLYLLHQFPQSDQLYELLLNIIENLMAQSWCPPFTGEQLTRFADHMKIICSSEEALWTLIHSIEKLPTLPQEKRYDVPAEIIKVLLDSACIQTDSILKLSALSAINTVAQFSNIPSEIGDLLLKLEATAPDESNSDVHTHITTFTSKLILDTCDRIGSVHQHILQRMSEKLDFSISSDERIYCAEYIYKAVCTFHAGLTTPVLKSLGKHFDDPSPDIRIHCRGAFAQGLLRLYKKNGGIPADLVEYVPRVFTATGLLLRKSQDTEPEDFTHTINNAILEIYQATRQVEQSTEMNNEILKEVERFVQEQRAGILPSRIEIFRKSLLLLDQETIEPSEFVLAAVERVFLAHEDESLATDCINFMATAFERVGFLTRYRASQSFLEQLSRHFWSINRPGIRDSEWDPNVKLHYLECLHYILNFQELPLNVFEDYHMELGGLRLASSVNVGEEKSTECLFLERNFLKYSENSKPFDWLRDYLDTGRNLSTGAEAALRACLSCGGALRLASEELLWYGAIQGHTFSRDLVQLSLTPLPDPPEQGFVLNLGDLIWQGWGKTFELKSKFPIQNRPHWDLHRALAFGKNQELPTDFGVREFEKYCSLSKLPKESNSEEVLRIKVICTQFLLPIRNRPAHLDTLKFLDVAHKLIFSQSSLSYLSFIEIFTESLVPTLERLISEENLCEGSVNLIFQMVAHIFSSSSDPDDCKISAIRLIGTLLLQRNLTWDSELLEQISGRLLSSLVWADLRNEMARLVDRLDNKIEVKLRDAINFDVLALCTQPHLLSDGQIVRAVCKSIENSYVVEECLSQATLSRLLHIIRISSSARKSLLRTLKESQHKESQDSIVIAVATLASLAWLQPALEDEQDLMGDKKIKLVENVNFLIRKFPAEVANVSGKLSTVGLKTIQGRINVCNSDDTNNGDFDVETEKRKSSKSVEPVKESLRISNAQAECKAIIEAALEWEDPDTEMYTWKGVRSPFFLFQSLQKLGGGVSDPSWISNLWTKIFSKVNKNKFSPHSYAFLDLWNKNPDDELLQEDVLSFFLPGRLQLFADFFDGKRDRKLIYQLVEILRRSLPESSISETIGQSLPEHSDPENRQSLPESDETNSALVALTNHTGCPSIHLSLKIIIFRAIHTVGQTRQLSTQVVDSIVTRLLETPHNPIVKGLCFQILRNQRLISPEIFEHTEEAWTTIVTKAVDEIYKRIEHFVDRADAKATKLDEDLMETLYGLRYWDLEGLRNIPRDEWRDHLILANVLHSARVDWNIRDRQELLIIRLLSLQLVQLLKLRQQEKIISSLLSPNLVAYERKRYSMTPSELLHSVVTHLEDPENLEDQTAESHQTAVGLVRRAMAYRIGRLIRTKSISAGLSPDGLLVATEYVIEAFKSRIKTAEVILGKAGVIEGLDAILFFCNTVQKFTPKELNVIEVHLQAAANLAALKKQMFITLALGRDALMGLENNLEILEHIVRVDSGARCVYELAVAFEKQQNLLPSSSQNPKILQYILTEYLTYKDHIDFNSLTSKLLRLKSKTSTWDKEFDNFVQTSTTLAGKTKIKSPELVLQELFAMNEGSDGSHVQGSKPSTLKRIGNAISRVLNGQMDISENEKAELAGCAKLVSSRKSRLDPSDVLNNASKALKLLRDWDLSPVQRTSIMIALSKDEYRGQVQQVGTGSGKSTIIAVLAMAKALEGNKVDVHTSSSILAKRDATEWSDFFAMFGLKCAHNGDRGFPYSSGTKGCYKEDVHIVYGDIKQFQFDTLRDEYADLGTRGGRPYDFAIVDEVDSICIDDRGKLAILDFSIPGMELLQLMYHLIWVHLEGLLGDDNGYVTSGDHTYHVTGSLANKENSQCYTYFDGKTECTINDINEWLDVNWEHLDKLQSVGIQEKWSFIRSNLEEKIKSLLNDDTMELPRHVKNFACSQIRNWACSAIMASVLHENEDYIVSKGEIQPLDPNNGVVQVNSSWNNGLQQFLQIKHSLRVTPEPAMTNFMSNRAMLNLYGSNLVGLTGTLGSAATREALEKLHNVECVEIPEPFVKRSLPLRSVVVVSQKDWTAEIETSTFNETGKGRGVLIICQSIVDAELIHNSLKQAQTTAQVKQYVRNDRSEEHRVERMQPGDIIVGTNLATRGMDIKVDAIEEAGGLHVILTYYPKSLRIEQQAFGRTGRQGRRGTTQFLIWDPKGRSIEDLQIEREKTEAEEYQTRDFEILEGKDKLFSRYKDELREIRGALIRRPSEYIFNELNQVRKTLVRAVSGANTLTSTDAILVDTIQEMWATYIKRVDDGDKSVRDAEEEFPNFIQKVRICYREPEVLFKLTPGNCFNPTRYAVKLYSKLPKVYSSLKESLTVPLAVDHAAAVKKLLESALKIDPDFAASAHVGMAYLKLSNWDVQVAGTGVNASKLAAVNHLWMAIKILLSEMATYRSCAFLAATSGSASPLIKALDDRCEYIQNYVSLLENTVQLVEDTLRPVDVTRMGRIRETVRIFGDSELSDRWTRTENETFQIKFSGLTSRRDVTIIDQALNTIDEMQNIMLDETVRASITVPVESVQKLLVPPNSVGQTLAAMVKGFTSSEHSVVVDEIPLWKIISSHNISKFKLDFQGVSNWSTVKLVLNQLQDIISVAGNVTRVVGVSVTSADLENIFPQVDAKDQRFTVHMEHYCNGRGDKPAENVEVSPAVIRTVSFDISKISHSEMEAFEHKFKNISYFNLCITIPLPSKTCREELTELMMMWPPFSVIIGEVLVREARNLVQNLRRLEVDVAVTFHNLSWRQTTDIFAKADRKQLSMRQVILSPLKEQFEPCMTPNSDAMLRYMERRGLSHVARFVELKPIPWRSLAGVGCLVAVQATAGAALVFTGVAAPLGYLFIKDSVVGVKSLVEKALITTELTGIDYVMTKAAKLVLGSGVLGIGSLWPDSIIDQIHHYSSPAEKYARKVLNAMDVDQGSRWLARKAVKRQTKDVEGRVVDVLLKIFREAEMIDLWSSFFGTHKIRGEKNPEFLVLKWLDSFSLSPTGNEVRRYLRKSLRTAGVAQIHHFGWYLGTVVCQAAASIVTMTAVEYTANEICECIRKELKEYWTCYNHIFYDDTMKLELNTFKDVFTLECPPMRTVLRTVARFITEVVFRANGNFSSEPLKRSTRYPLVAAAQSFGGKSRTHDSRKTASEVDATVDELKSSEVTACRLMKVCADVLSRTEAGVGQHNDGDILDEAAIVMLASENKINLMLLNGDHTPDEEVRISLVLKRDSDRSSTSVELILSDGWEIEEHKFDGEDCVYAAMGTLVSVSSNQVKDQFKVAVEANPAAYNQLVSAIRWLGVLLPCDAGDFLTKIGVLRKPDPSFKQVTENIGDATTSISRRRRRVDPYKCRTNLF